MNKMKLTGISSTLDIAEISKTTPTIFQTTSQDFITGD